VRREVFVGLEILSNPNWSSVLAFPPFRASFPFRSLHRCRECSGFFFFFSARACYWLGWYCRVWSRVRVPTTGLFTPFAEFQRSFLLWFHESFFYREREGDIQPPFLLKRCASESRVLLLSKTFELSPTRALPAWLFFYIPILGTLRAQADGLSVVPSVICRAVCLVAVSFSGLIRPLRPFVFSFFCSFVPPFP